MDLLSAWGEMHRSVCTPLDPEIFSLTTTNMSSFKLFKWVNQLAYVGQQEADTEHILTW